MRKIAFRSLKVGKMRNIFIIITVAMTAALISGIAGFAAGVEKEEERQLDSMQHVVYREVTDEQMKALRKDGRTEELAAYKQGVSFETDGYALCAGYFEAGTKIISTPATAISEGHYPQKVNEIAVDKAYMEQIGKEPVIGAEVAVTWLDGSTETYLVSGYTDYKTDVKNYTIIFSKEYADGGSQLKNIPYSAAVRIFNAKDMSRDEFLHEIRSMGEAYGIERPRISENSRFVNNKSRTSFEFFALAGIGTAVLLASILVIYGVFYISVAGRIRQFGQLCTIGMTPKQIRRTVNTEGVILAFLGISLGLVVGTVFAYAVKPMGFSAPNMLVIWLVTAVTELLTVMFSIRKPAKIAASVSPVEAAKISGYEGRGKLSGNRKLTPFGLARISAEGNRKKSRMTALSLGIAGIFFLCGTTLLASFNREEYSRQVDFHFGEYLLRISSSAKQLAEHGMADIQRNNPLNEELRTQIASLDGVKNITVKECIGVTFEYNNYRAEDLATPFDREETELLSRHSESGARFDYDEMIRKKEIIITDNGVAEEIYGWRFQAGDPVLLRWYDGTDYREDVFKIAGSVDILNIYKDKDDRGRRLLMSGGWFLIPRGLVEAMVPDSCCLYDQFVVSVADWENDTEVKSFLETLADDNMTLSFGTLAEEMEQDGNSYNSLKYTIYGIAMFIMGFALINLMNTLVSNAMSRKREFAMLRSIGMSEGQLSWMMISEGLILAVKNIMVTAVFGTAAGYALIYAAKNMGADYFHWHFPVWYLLGYVIFVIAAPVFISEAVIRVLGKKTLVERLREDVNG